MRGRFWEEVATSLDRKVLAGDVLAGRSHFFGEKSTCGEGFGMKSTCGEGFGREKPPLLGRKVLAGKVREGVATSAGGKYLPGRFLEGEATSSGRKVLAGKVLGGRSYFFGEKSNCGEGFGGRGEATCTCTL